MSDPLSTGLKVLCGRMADSALIVVRLEPQKPAIRKCHIDVLTVVAISA